MGVVAPGGVELVEPIWSCPSSLLSFVALCGVSRVEEGIVAAFAATRHQLAVRECCRQQSVVVVVMVVR